PAHALSSILPWPEVWTEQPATTCPLHVPALPRPAGRRLARLPSVRLGRGRRSGSWDRPAPIRLERDACARVGLRRRSSDQAAQRVCDRLLAPLAGPLTNRGGPWPRRVRRPPQRRT